MIAYLYQFQIRCFLIERKRIAVILFNFNSNWTAIITTIWSHSNRLNIIPKINYLLYILQAPKLIIRLSIRIIITPNLIFSNKKYQISISNREQRLVGDYKFWLSKIQPISIMTFQVEDQQIWWSFKVQTKSKNNLPRRVTMKYYLLLLHN